MSVVEDGVEIYQPYMFHIARLWCWSPMKCIFFRFVIRISISLMIFMFKYVIFRVREEDAMNDALFTPRERENRTEQNLYFIDVNCTVSCQIHEYNNKFTNGHNRCIHDLTTKS